MPASCGVRTCGPGRGSAGAGRLLHFGLSEVAAGAILLVLLVLVLLGCGLWPPDEVSAASTAGDGGVAALDSPPEPPGREPSGAGWLFHFGLAVLVSGNNMDGCLGLVSGSVSTAAVAAGKSSSEGYRLDITFDLRTDARAVTDAPREGRRRITGACSAVAATTTELYLQCTESMSRGMSAPVKRGATSRPGSSGGGFWMSVGEVDNCTFRF